MEFTTRFGLRFQTTRLREHAERARRLRPGRAGLLKFWQQLGWLLLL